MIPNNASREQFQDRIKLPFSFDPNKILEETNVMRLRGFEYYDVLPLRAPAHLVDTSLPIPPPSDNYADGSWTKWLDTQILKNSPYLNSIIATFSEHTKVNLVRLLRLAPHAVVKEHTDPTLAMEEERSMIRLTIPIISNDHVAFYLNDALVPMKPGECWYLRLTDPHRIDNFGDTERINLTIDMIPNKWLSQLIMESQRSG